MSLDARAKEEGNGTAGMQEGVETVVGKLMVKQGLCVEWVIWA